MSVVYLDASALTKLVIGERESAALQSWLRDLTSATVIATSSLSRVELTRAAHRHSEAAATTARLVLSATRQIAMTPETLDAAAAISSSTVRSLDAIHLATALGVRAELAAFVVLTLVWVRRLPTAVCGSSPRPEPSPAGPGGTASGVVLEGLGAAVSCRGDRLAARRRRARPPVRRSSDQNAAPFDWIYTRDDLNAFLRRIETHDNSRAP